jgi:5'-AMP-activated protein kinase catalytic alpha subunit
MKDGEFLRTSCGSPNYAAPEVIAGQLYSGAGADIWSIGVILYAMLVGHLPFDEESLPVLFRRITEGKYSIPSTVSASAADLISRILVVDVISRATMQVIKSHPWFLDGFPAYLAINPEDLPEFDEDTVAAVADKLRTTHDDVREKIRQLSSGNEDVVCGSDDADVPQHTAWIAYNVMLDTKAVYMKYAMTHCMDIPTLLTTSNTPELVSMESEICRSYPLGSSFLTRCNVVGESSPESSQLEACSTWSVGLPAGRGPADCMRHIFLVLQYRVTDVEWRILAPFQLALRSTSSYKGCVVGLQLFKMRPSIAGTLPPSCIVDFFVMGGSIMVAADFIIYLVQACRELNFPRTPAYSRSTQLAT